MNNQTQNKPTKNYAYIDSQNLNLTIQNLGWNVDWAKFRKYLETEHNVGVAYLFIGYIAENQELYSFLQKAGFVIIFKPVVIGKEGNIKGNIDAELVLQVMIDQQQYDKAVIVTGDGDFHGLVNYLYAQNKLQCLLVPNMRQYSSLLKQAARDKIDYISNMRKELEYKKGQRRYNNAERTKPVDSSSASEAATAAAAPTTSATPAAPSKPAAASTPERPRRRTFAQKAEDSLMAAVENASPAPAAPVTSTPAVASVPRARVTKTGSTRSYRPSTAPGKPAEVDKPVDKPAT